MRLPLPSISFAGILRVILLAQCLGLMLVGRPAAAQSERIKFTVLTANDGLSSNTVTAILKDRSGLLWIATEEGLNKYDGHLFKTYQFGAENTAGFRAVEVSSLHEDQAGRLWVGTVGKGLFTYNRAQDCFTAVPANSQANMLDSQLLKSVCSDFLGNLWLVTLSGVRVLNPTTSKVTRITFGNSPEQPLKTFCVYEDHQKRIWLGTNRGLYRYDRAANAFKRYAHDQTKPTSSLVGDTVRTLAEDQYGHLWVGTSNGLSQLRDDEKTFTNFKFNYQDPTTISSNFIYSIAADRNGTIWVGSEGGLDVLDVKTGTVARYAHNSRDAFSLHSKSIRTILIDSQGIHWIGTYKGGVNKYDPNLTLFDGRRSSELDPFGLNAPLVTAFAERPDGDIYVGTDGGGLSLYHPNTGLFDHISLKSSERTNLAGLPILCLLLDRHAQLWIGTYDHGLFVYDTRTGKYRQLLRGGNASDLNNNQIFCLEEDRAGNIWIGTNSGGVNVYNPRSQRITKFVSHPHAPGEQHLPFNDYIRAIKEDRQGNIWIGTAGSGLLVYHPQNQQTTVYNYARMQLPLDYCSTLQQDRAGNMWIGTSDNGLFRFNTQKHRLTAYSKPEGLPNRVVHRILEDNAGTIWVSTNHGLSRLDLKRKKFVNYTQDNGLQNNAFLPNSGIKLANGSLFFGGIEGFTYFNPTELKINQHIPPVVFTELKIDNKPVVAGDQSPTRPHIAVAKQLDIAYKQNFAIQYAALNYTLPQKNQYAYQLKGFDQDWNYVGSATTAYYTNLDPGEYEFVVKASNNDGLWNTSGAHIKVIIHPPFWKTIYAYLLYLGLFGVTLLYIRYRGIRKLKREFAQQQTQKEAERVRELDLLKIKFLTNLSHEFRTPISLILAPTEKLLAQPSDAERAGHLQVIRRNANRLLHLVNQLLDFRKLEEHELRLDLSEGEITGFVQEVTDSFQDLAEVKNIDLSLRVPAETLRVRFDHDKVERILVNLLANAVKFTPAGGQVSVDVAFLPAPPQTSERPVRIRIADTGVGIPRHKQALIFDRFFQGHEGTAFLHQSSGIGLSITKEFVQLHGGTIAVASEPGAGTTFTVVLPLAGGAPAADSPPARYAGEPAQQKLPATPGKRPTGEALPHLLLVEDDDDFRCYLKDCLKDHYKITDVLNGKEGWSKALSCHPDLIVSDVTMPYLDGVALSRKLKADKRTCHIPIILLTGLTQANEQLKGLESGANDYLTKPFNFDILHARINNLLELNHALKTTYTKQLQVMPSHVEIESSSEKFLQKVVVYIEKNLKNTAFSVEELSDHVGMSRSSLYHKLLELTGLSPVEFIRSFKLDRAAILLQQSDLTISEVAYQAGFATPHYFTKSFKAKFNILPSDYRKNSQQAGPGTGGL